MKKIRRIACLVGAAVIMSGCASAKLTRRFYSAISVTDANDSALIRVSAFVMGVPASPAGSLLLELSPQAQCALVKEIAGKTSTLEAFLGALKGGGMGEKGDGDIIDATRFKKRVVFSVEKGIDDDPGKLGPADRVSELLVQLSIPSAACFLSWNRFETKYEYVDLGKLSSTQGGQVGLSGTMIPQTNLLPSTIPITAQLSRSMAEEVLLKQRYVAISGTLAPQVARLYQQGVTGIDLAGNFLVDFDIQLNNNIVGWKTLTMISSLNTKGTANPPDKIQVVFKTLKYPLKSDAIICSLENNFVLRRVLNGGQSIIEGDDVVQFASGHGKAEFELLSEADLNVRIYSLRSYYLKKEGASKDGFELHLKGFRETPIYFLGFGMAQDFLSWVKETHSTRIAQFALELNGLPLDVKDIPSLEIHTINLNCMR